MPEISTQDQHEDATPCGLIHSVWLRVQLEHRVYVFEFEAGSQRAVVVGAVAGAEIRVTRAGVSPLQLHFEREGDGVCLVPAYQVDLHVDGRPCTRPHTFRTSAKLEFCGLALFASVHAVAPELPHAGVSAPFARRTAAPQPGFASAPVRSEGPPGLTVTEPPPKPRRGAGRQTRWVVNGLLRALGKLGMLTQEHPAWVGTLAALFAMLLTGALLALGGR